jgi:uncharacterized integral membrane protein
MAFLRMIFALPLIIGAVMFALAHPEKVLLTYSPLSEPIELPLYFVALAFLGIGFLLGVFCTWLGMGKLRKERRAYKKEVKKLTKENEKLTTEKTKAENELEKLNPDVIQGN